MAKTVATHWGVYEAGAEGLSAWPGDPAPSAMHEGLLEAREHPARVLTPCVRRSYLEHGPGHAGRWGGRRGGEAFVAVSWERALDLVAGEISRVRGAFGNGAIFGGSYGWSSAGRFHHAQSQVHRFLNSVGGYVRSVGNYSFGAADVILPHVIGSSEGLSGGHTPWAMVAGHAELLVLFGGVPGRDLQVSAGGIARHGGAAGLQACREGGADLVSVSPIRDDTDAGLGAEWVAVRPGTDVALMLGLAHVLISEGLCDLAFLGRYTVGFERLRDYVLDGRTPDWAAGVTGVPCPAIVALARRMAARRTMIMVGWSLQRARHGEQPVWMAVALAAMLGGIGLPGRGVGFGYGSSGGIGLVPNGFAWPALPQGRNGVEAFIPVARIADMLLQPGGAFAYDGRVLAYPDVRLVYWAGGNPFHHHQDLNRLVRAWQRPETVVVHEAFWNAHARHADIVLPVATMLERNDVACAARDRFIAASHKVQEPPAGVLTDFSVFCALAGRLGVEEVFSEGLDEAGWLRRLYGEAVARAAGVGVALPAFERFWAVGVVEVPEGVGTGRAMLAGFRADPVRHRLGTPSGLIELASEVVAGFGYADCPGHPAWLDPGEWLGAADVGERLHLVSNQPGRRLHSQYDHGAHSQAGKVAGREALRLNPGDAAARGIGDGDVVRVFNARGAMLAGAVLDDAVMAGVVQVATGAWYDPDAEGVCRSGNPNVLTSDRGTSLLSQGPDANTCLVFVERVEGAVEGVGCYGAPEILSGV